MHHHALVRHEEAVAQVNDPLAFASYAEKVSRWPNPLNPVFRKRLFAGIFLKRKKRNGDELVPTEVLLEAFDKPFSSKTSNPVFQRGQVRESILLAAAVLGLVLVGKLRR
jgi:hypothetical protein